jgi:hypothetical protein
MNLADVEKMESALLARRLPWAVKAAKLIATEVDDAKAHAQNAITATLKDIDDGRSAQRKLDANRSFTAAVDHLDSLRDSLFSLIKDARVAFYRDSIKLWLPHIEVEYRVNPDPAPTKDGEALMRDAVIGGYSLAMELDPSIDQAKRTLKVAASVAGRRGQSDRDSDQQITLWANRTGPILTRKIESILSDSDTSIHEATGWLLVAPKYRGQRMVDPGAGLQF